MAKQIAPRATCMMFAFHPAKRGGCAILVAMPEIPNTIHTANGGAELFQLNGDAELPSSPTPAKYDLANIHPYPALNPRFKTFAQTNPVSIHSNPTVNTHVAPTNAAENPTSQADCLRRSCGVATEERKASRTPLKAMTGRYTDK